MTAVWPRNGINIKDIEIFRVREGEGGTLRLALESEADLETAIRELQCGRLFRTTERLSGRSSWSRSKDVTRQGIVIAIDGPAGAGKSTVARAVARALNYLYIDTGAMYRAIALAVLEAGIRPDDAEAVERLARTRCTWSWSDAAAGNRVLLDGRDVTEPFGRPKCLTAVSPVAAHSGRPRSFGGAAKAAGGAGRGRHGRPGHRHRRLADADVKLFLTASVESGRAGGGWSCRRPVTAGRWNRIRANIESRDRLDATATFRRCARRRTPSKSIRPTKPWTKWSSWSWPSFGRS